MTEWQPIATAPKNGAEFVARTISGRVHILRWDGPWWQDRNTARVYRSDELAGWHAIPEWVAPQEPT